MKIESEIKKLVEHELYSPLRVNPIKGDKKQLGEAIDEYKKLDITYCCCIHDCYGNFSSNQYCPCLRTAGHSLTRHLNKCITQPK